MKVSFGLAIFLIPFAFANQTIRVVLFGQPCSLEGPVSKSTLKSIHAISPDQIPRLTSAKEAEDAKRKLASAGRPPRQLRTYKELLQKHILAELAFYEAVQGLKKKKNRGKFLEKIKPHFRGKMDEPFLVLVNRTQKKPTPDMIEQLHEKYSLNIIANPEPDFHRAIRKMKVRYDCSFDETNSASDTGGEEESERD